MRRLALVCLLSLLSIALSCGSDEDDDPASTTDAPAEVESAPGDATTIIPEELTTEEREEAGDIYELDEAEFAAAVAAETDCEKLRHSFRVSGLGVEQGDIDADKQTVVDRAGVIAERLNELDCYGDQ